MELTAYALIFVVVLFLLYKLGTRNMNYWKNKGFKQTNTYYPFVGDHYLSALSLADIMTASKRLYNLFPGEKFGGMYIMQSPVLLIRDPELLKSILVKDAEHFINRNDWSFGGDELISRNLVALKDEKWRNLRMVMTTVFTTAKMKDMFKFMEKCAEQSAEHMLLKLEEQIRAKGSDANVLELEFKDYFSRYGTDVIASTAFGFEVNSFKNPENEFYAAAETLKNATSFLNTVKIVFMLCFPKLAQMLRLTFFGSKLNDYLISVVKDAIRQREEHNIVRKDVIHILMQARKGKGVDENGELIKGKLPELTDIDIAAQGLLFYFGGFDTVATLLSFLSYELALNPDLQENLHEEIDRAFDGNEELTYDVLMYQMTYLDMLINETLRKWPPTQMTDRMVTKAYTLPKTDTTPELTLEKGDKVWIPLAGLHYDPEYFPNPDKFDPERFRDEKNTVKPYTFLPFGAGIRHCIGMRYALMEAKTCIVHLLRKFVIVPTENSEIPLKLQKGFILRTKNGFVMGLKRRN